MSLSETIRKMNEMRLFGMARSLDERMKTAIKQELSHEELLGFLADDEYYYRQNNRLRRLLQNAKLRIPQACFEEIDYKHPRGLVKSKVLGLQNKEWIESSQNILITGPTGIGKSYLSSALGQWSCRQGHQAFYRRWPKLLEELYAARGEGSYSKRLEKLTKVKVLVIDDFGIHALNDQGRKDLLEIVEERYKVGATVITSQLEIKDWHEHIGDPTIADAVLDRLFHDAHKFELTGPSMRRDNKKA